jgi:D-alanyl-D-alanine carboxypeptidase (penicillin-binding protein 5/6)
MLRRLPHAFPAVCCLLALLTTGTLAAAPPQVPAPPAVGAKAYIVADHRSGKVIASLRENERLDPASITKLMTAYVVFRAIRDQRIGLDDPVTISETAWRTGGSRSFIDLGSQVPVSVLLQGMIIQSGNDASVALAEHVAGSESAFADLMNQYAKELGMTGSSYRNATGLPDPEHYTTAADILKVANAIISEFPEFYKWYSQKEYSWNGITQSNRNGLLWRDSTVDGMKTGFTETAGYCLVASALRDNMRLVSVVLGTESPSAREKDSQTLLNYGFRFYQTTPVLTAGKPLVEARVWKAGVDLASLGARDDVWVTIPRGAVDQLKTVPSVPPRLIAPLEPGQAVGQVEVRLEDQVVAKAPLYPLAAVAEGSLWQQARDTVLLWLE